MPASVEEVETDVGINQAALAESAGKVESIQTMINIGGVDLDEVEHMLKELQKTINETNAQEWIMRLSKLEDDFEDLGTLVNTQLPMLANDVATLKTEQDKLDSRVNSVEWTAENNEADIEAIRGMLDKVQNDIAQLPNQFPTVINSWMVLFLLLLLPLLSSLFSLLGISPILLCSFSFHNFFFTFNKVKPNRERANPMMFILHIW